MATVSFSNVCVVKDGQTILDGIDLNVTERRVGIIGRNGSGKSTFARLFNGLQAPTRGRVSFDGEEGAAALRRKVGFVFQNPDNQIIYPLVEEDLAFGLKQLKLPEAELRARIEAILERFGIGDLRTRLTHTLSGGEKQMVALAGVLVMQPRLIVFDEPTTLLDLWNTLRLMALIDELDEQAVIVSHDLDLMRDFDRVLHIDAGRIVDDGPPETVIAGYIAQSQC